jgi:predicted enzyme related to lactoylglutathione lyase
VSRVTGIGGVFFKSADPDGLREWYRRHLGVDVRSWGGATFRWRDEPEGVTVWSLFPASSSYFDPSPTGFMINYRVADLHRVLAELRGEGCKVDDRIEESEFGRFGWVMDPDGNRVELWEPPPGRFPG